MGVPVAQMALQVLACMAEMARGGCLTPWVSVTKQIATLVGTYIAKAGRVPGTWGPVGHSLHHTLSVLRPLLFSVLQLLQAC